MVDLRNEVVVAVQGIEDESLLRDILELILRGNSKEKYLLSAEEKANIEVSREQYKNGQTRNHQAAMEETKKWLMSN